MVLNEQNKKLVAMAHDKTAESTFVMILGKALVDVGRELDGQSYVSRVRSNLEAGIRHVQNSEAIPPDQQDRLQMLDHLLTVTMARHLGLGHEESSTHH